MRHLSILVSLAGYLTDHGHQNSISGSSLWSALDKRVIYSNLIYEIPRYDTFRYRCPWLVTWPATDIKTWSTGFRMGQLVTSIKFATIWYINDLDTTSCWLKCLWLVTRPTTDSETWSVELVSGQPMTSVTFATIWHTKQPDDFSSSRDINWPVIFRIFRSRARRSRDKIF